MILRLSDSLSRGLLVIGSLAIALWVSFFGVRSGIAGLAADGNSRAHAEKRHPQRDNQGADDEQAS